MKPPRFEYVAPGSVEEALGVEVRPNAEAELITQTAARPYRYVVTAANIGESRQPSGQTFQVECKVLILAAGAMGNPPLLMRSRATLPAHRRAQGRQRDGRGRRQGNQAHPRHRGVQECQGRHRRR